MKKASALMVLAVLFFPFFSLGATRQGKGANVTILKKDGFQLSGKLVAVKKDFLVLSSPGSEAVSDQSIAVADVREVKVIRHSNAGSGALIGLLAGAAFGAAAAAGENDTGGPFHFGAGYSIAVNGVGYALIGALIGSGTGGNKSFVLENIPETVRQARLVNLSRFARVQGLQ